MIDTKPLEDRVFEKYPGIDAEQAGREYRDFLSARADGIEQSPSDLADLIWHEHVLDTKRYAQDCGRLFGRFLHHVPSGKYCFGETE
jgi:hypothetical protein